MNKIQDLLLTLALLILAIGVPLGIFQLHQTKIATQAAAQAESARFILEFNNQLRNAPASYTQIISLLVQGEAILKPDGPFSAEAMDNYLNMWEVLNQFSKGNEITKGMAYDTFSFPVETAYCSPEIKNFILQSRESFGNPSTYGGFAELAKTFLARENIPPCPVDFLEISYE